VSELFDEVDEEVRRDQLKKLWDQYSIYIVAGALLQALFFGTIWMVPTHWSHPAMAA